MHQSRRAFLRRMGIGLGSGAALATIDNLTLTSALAQGSGYRALVCIFLAGGNDGNNMVIPNDNPGWNLYFNERSGAGLAHPRTGANSILPITVPALSNAPFGLHPRMTQLRDLYNQGRLAFVTNVGPLVEPLHTTPGQTPRQRYINNPNLRPIQLFSHSDQVAEWQTAVANASAQTGWGGRTADQFPLHSSGMPMVTSVGNPRFGLGALRRQLSVPSANNNGQPANLATVLNLNGFNFNLVEDRSRRDTMAYFRGIDNEVLMRAVASATMEQAIQVQTAFSTADFSLSTVFPNTDIGNQLLQIARAMKANLTQPALGLTHQIFFVQVGGFDTHQRQNDPNFNTSQVSLLTRLSAAMSAFYNATVELGNTVYPGLPSRVTTFTLSDFSRTFNPSGAGVNNVGTDHAWGNHMMVMGDSVIGGNFYGVSYSGSPYGIYPNLVKGNPGNMDTGTRGSWVPTCSVDQYANTLARWFGLPQDVATLNAVFPLLVPRGFNPRFLNFMRPLT